MTTEQIIGLILALLIMGIGALGSLLPGLPSTPLVLLAAVAHKLWFGDAGVHWSIMVLLVLLTAFSMVLDYLATVVGARQFGASRRAALAPSGNGGRGGHWILFWRLWLFGGCLRRPVGGSHAAGTYRVAPMAGSLAGWFGRDHWRGGRGDWQSGC